MLCRHTFHHPLVQRHVYGAVSKILAMHDGCKLLNCVLLPLCVSGAHLRNTQLQQRLLHKLDQVHRCLKFESVDCVKQWLSRLWALESPPQSWADLFKDLNPQAVVI